MALHGENEKTSNRASESLLNRSEYAYSSMHGTVLKCCKTRRVKLLLGRAESLKRTKYKINGTATTAIEKSDFH